jgi:hypothetical protein
MMKERALRHASLFDDPVDAHAGQSHSFGNLQSSAQKAVAGLAGLFLA